MRGETFMLYTFEINKALKLISEVHKNQVDKAGVAYILHPYEVANDVYNYLYYKQNSCKCLNICYTLIRW